MVAIPETRSIGGIPHLTNSLLTLEMQPGRIANWKRGGTVRMTDVVLSNNHGKTEQAE